MTLLVLSGRCRSGGKWFWFATATPDPGQEWHACGSPVCTYGGDHDLGWSDSEPEALASLRDAVTRLGGDPRCVRPGGYGYSARLASTALSRLAAARRTAARLPRLRKAMLAAHPDAGGTAEEFVTARARYEQAERAARTVPAR